MCILHVFDALLIKILIFIFQLTEITNDFKKVRMNAGNQEKQADCEWTNNFFHLIPSLRGIPVMFVICSLHQVKFLKWT